MTISEFYRARTPTGRLLDQVLEHEFDCKHYKIDPGDVTVEIREGLKILEQERNKWETETRERKQIEFENERRVREIQRQQQSRSGGF